LVEICLIVPRVNLIRRMIETRDRTEAECCRISTAAPHCTLQARWARKCCQGVIAGHIVIPRHVGETIEIRKPWRWRGLRRGQSRSGCGCRRGCRCRTHSRMHQNPHNDHDNEGHDCHDGQSDHDPPPRKGTHLHHRPSPNDDRRTARYGKLAPWRRHRLHPLGDTELLTYGGVTQSAQRQLPDRS
jgi:hypothetical protein